MRFQHLLSIVMVPALCGCVAMGGVAEHVDPAEAQLVKRLASELCKVNFTYKGESHSHKTETVRAAFVGVADIIDNRADEGRVASIMVKGGRNDFSYNPLTAMAYCGLSPISADGFVYYDQVSQTLVDHGGNPEIYRKRKITHDAYAAVEKARRNKQEEQDLRTKRMLDATFPIRAQWEGIEGTLYGSIREVRVGKEGTMVVTLPGSLGVCTGDYQYTGRNIGTWALSCPNDLTASGTFKSGKGARGEGTDNSGRKITYTIGVPG